MHQCCRTKFSDCKGWIYSESILLCLSLNLTCKNLTNYVEIYLRSLESSLIQLLCKYTPDVGRDYEISTHIDIVDA